MFWCLALIACLARFLADLMFATTEFPSVGGLAGTMNRLSGPKEPRIIRALPPTVNASHWRFVYDHRWAAKSLIFRCISG
jgi:hypothetical protein